LSGIEFENRDTFHVENFELGAFRICRAKRGFHEASTRIVEMKIVLLYLLEAPINKYRPQRRKPDENKTLTYYKK
jgi:hypothetical protein